MDQVYATYVDDEHVDNHAYDDDTVDGHGNIKDSYGHNNDYETYQYSMYFEFNYRRRYEYF